VDLAKNIPIFLMAMYTGSMAISWKEAREYAVKEGLPLVFHDCDAGTYGACRNGEHQGTFKGGAFTVHRCICMPSNLMPEELAEKERKFLEENPDW